MFLLLTLQLFMCTYAEEFVDLMHIGKVMFTHIVDLLSDRLSCLMVCVALTVVLTWCPSSSLACSGHSVLRQR